MSTATAVQPTRATALAQTQGETVVPENSLTGFKRRIAAYAFDNGVELGSSKISRLATRIKKRADVMQDEFDFYESLRVLGIHTDSTARDAIKSIDRGRA